MSVQTSYTINMIKAFAGLLADQRPIEVDSKLWADVKTVGFGRFVARGTTDATAVLPTASSDLILGPVVAHQNAELGRDMSQFLSDTTIKIGEHSALNVLRTGNIYVNTESACTPGAAVFVRYAGKKQVQTITFAGDLITANVINLNVGGIAISPVTFGTDHATTIAAVATAITTANSDIYSAVASGRVITVTTVQDADDQNVTNVVVTAGATQTTATVVETHASFSAATTLGNVRTDADSSSAVEVGWEFEETGIAGAVVKIRKK